MENLNSSEDEDHVSSEQEENASSSVNKGDDEDENMKKLFEYLAQKLELTDTSDGVRQSRKKILNRLDIDGIVEYIKENDCKKIITMAGAGISTSAGIPDFRSPSSGLYHNLQKYNLPYPQAIFELDFFKSNPKPFFDLAKQLLIEDFKPTPSHYFIKLLSEKGLLLRHYTQNIDTLERTAGLSSEKLVAAHGSFRTGQCLKCRAIYDLPWMRQKMVEDVPKCEKCSDGIVKPDIVFFGEMLPDRFYKLVDSDYSQADLLIIMGTSLVVQPFAHLIDRVKKSCPRLLINKEKVKTSCLFGGFDFDPKNTETGRDVAWNGDCDAGCQLLADKLGWGEELKKLVETEHQRLDAEKNHKL